MLIELNSREQIRIRLGQHLFYLQGDDDGLQLSCLGSTMNLKPILDCNPVLTQSVKCDQVFIKAQKR